MTSHHGGGEKPQPGDVVIGFKVSCSATSPGLDGKRDRVIRISYRPKRLGPPPKDVNPLPGTTGAFPTPRKPGARTGGVTVGADGIVWIDTQVYGQPDKNLTNSNRGDDSEDIASRIEETVETARLDKKVDGQDIEVQHNGQSDVDPDGPRGGPCPDKKPQDKKGGGRGRIIIRQPSHVDAACDDGKIQITIIVIPLDGIPPGGGGGGGAIEIITLEDSLPGLMPDERGGEGGWDKPQPVDPSDRRPPKDPNKKGEPDPYLREDVPWKRPPWKPRRWVKTSHRSQDWFQPHEAVVPLLLVAAFGNQSPRESIVHVVSSVEKQIDLLVGAFKSVGFDAFKRGPRSFAIARRSQEALLTPPLGFSITMQAAPWHLIYETLADDSPWTSLARSASQVSGIWPGAQGAPSPTLGTPSSKSGGGVL